jgi:polyhydroxybutyrate depolymerase
MFKQRSLKLAGIVASALLFTLTFGCAPGPEQPSMPSTPPLPVDYTPLSSAGCGNELTPGIHVFNITHDGLNRTYDLVIPSSYDSSVPMPLMMNLHSLTMGGGLHGIWRTISGLNVNGEKNGYIVVQPDGTPRDEDSFYAWNAGLMCCQSPESTVDDVDFIATVIENVKNEVCIDERRVVAAGMSNGAYLAYRIACEVPDMFAGIAPIVGSLSTELNCIDGRAVPVFAISGSEDNLASREASVASFVDINACNDTTEVSFQSGDVTCTNHTECDDGAQVTHCIVDGGGHCYFGANDNILSSVGCAVRNDIVSEDLIWWFLSQQSLPL